MSAPGFWDDSEKAQALINRNNAAKETYDQFQAIANETDELNLMWEMHEYDRKPGHRQPRGPGDYPG